MRSTKSMDLIGHSKILLWGQLDGCSVTRPFLSLRRVWLARLELALLYTENSGGEMGGDQFSKVSGVQGIYEATKQTMPIFVVTTESPRSSCKQILLSGETASANLVGQAT